MDCLLKVTMKCCKYSSTSWHAGFQLVNAKISTKVFRPFLLKIIKFTNISSHNNWWTFGHYSLALNNFKRTYRVQVLLIGLSKRKNMFDVVHANNEITTPMAFSGRADSLWSVFLCFRTNWLFGVCFYDFGRADSFFYVFGRTAWLFGVCFYDFGRADSLWNVSNLSVE